LNTNAKSDFRIANRKTATAIELILHTTKNARILTAFAVSGLAA